MVIEEKMGLPIRNHKLNSDWQAECSELNKASSVAGWGKPREGMACLSCGCLLH